MGRLGRQLLATGAVVAPFEAGIEIVWIESLLEFSALDAEGQAVSDVMPISCVFLNFAPTALNTERLRRILGNVLGVRVRYAYARNAAALLADLHKRSDAQACAVLLLDDHVDATTPDVTEAVNEVLSAARNSLGLVVAVSTNSTKWLALTALDGFVKARPGEAATVAVDVFTALASTAAPQLWSCLDDEDIAPTLGCASRPSQMVAAWIDVDAIWHFAAEDGGRVVAQSSTVVAFLFVEAAGRITRKQVVEVLRAVVPKGVSLVYQIAVGYIDVAGAGGRHASAAVTLLCREAEAPTICNTCVLL